jgi:nucleoside-diphosphate-sugar epimerase
MRVLLAGASGAIGRYLVPQLIAAGHSVVGITRTPGSLDGTGAKEVVADVLDRPALFAAVEKIRADVVIHQVTSLAKTPTTFRAMRPTNRLRAEGTSALIAVARRVGAKKFVAASFFGGYGLHDLGRKPLTETAPFGDRDGTADGVQAALLSLEQQVRAFGGVSLRFGLFYDGSTTSISPVSRTWDGVLPMLHISDAAAATVSVLATYRAAAVYNIADDDPVSYRAREEMRAKAAHHRRPLALSDSVLQLAAPYGSLLLTRTSMVLSTERAKSELGWEPRFASLREGLGMVKPVQDETVQTIASAVSSPVEPTVSPSAEPTETFGRTAELSPELESIFAPKRPDPVDAVEPEPEPKPEPEVEPEIEPQPAEKPETAAVAEPAVKPAARRQPVRRPKTSTPSAKPDDPFRDAAAAIARIGGPRD